MGEKYLSTGSFDLKEIYEESTAKTPLIFILSPSKFSSCQDIVLGKTFWNLGSAIQH